MTIRLGFQIPNFSYGTGVEELFPTVIAQAREAESAGFDAVFVMDHFYQLPMLGSPDQPMLEVMKLLRANGYRTYFVTGGGQDFVRVYAEQVYGIPPEQVVGSASATQFGYDKSGKAVLTKVPKLLLMDDNIGKPEGIHLVIGRRPVAAFGNSIGDKQMLEYTQAGDGARLMMLVHHDDATREFAYGPTSRVGTFPDALMAQAKKQSWVVISMKNDWKRIFAFE